MKAIKEFKKTKDLLICIDSDGCVLDTMEIKHMRCFGPCLVHEWGLSEYREEIVRLWRKINLLSKDRGVNRFVGLGKVLEDINDNYFRVEGLAGYQEWVKNAKELSDQSAAKAYEETGNPCIKKALEWSELVNQSLMMISMSKKQPFGGAEEAVRLSSEYADVAIATAANGAEIKKEWKNLDILKYADVLTSQENGTKARCLKALVEKGYEPQHVLMLGDAPADLEAAKAVGALFYPILAYQERESWEEFPEALKHFREGTYAGEYQDKKIQEFEENLRL
nr:HAD hydrolase-like protein [uncultured Blautia sp.]